MFVFRIVKDKIRTEDLSGIGAAKVGGRCNPHIATTILKNVAISLQLLHFKSSKNSRITRNFRAYTLTQCVCFTNTYFCPR